MSLPRLALASCALALATVPAARAEQLVLDQDLTRGAAAFTGTARGGEWRHGWRLRHAGDRLVWDAGRAIKNGRFEFWLTTDTPPFSPIHEKEGKADRPDFHWAGISGIPEIAMTRHAFALRLGEIKLGDGKGHGWSKILVLGPGNRVATEKTEKPFGNYADWLPLSDGRHVIHFQLEWRDGVAALIRADGTRHECPLASAGGPPVRIADLRYAWLGGADDERRFTFAGMRFLRARLIDLDRPGTVAPATMPALIIDPK